MFEQFFDEVEAEVIRANGLHADLNSPHEAIGVIMEEFDKLKAEAWKKEPEKFRLRKGLRQIAAVCVRAVQDLEL